MPHHPIVMSSAALARAIGARHLATVPPALHGVEARRAFCRPLALTIMQGGSIPVLCDGAEVLAWDPVPDQPVPDGDDP